MAYFTDRDAPAITKYLACIAKALKDLETAPMEERSVKYFLTRLEEHRDAEHSNHLLQQQASPATAETLPDLTQSFDDVLREFLRRA